MRAQPSKPLRDDPRPQDRSGQNTAPAAPGQTLAQVQAALEAVDQAALDAAEAAASRYGASTAPAFRSLRVPDATRPGRGKA